MKQIHLSYSPVILIVSLLAVAISISLGFASGFLCQGYRCYLPGIIRRSKSEKVYRQDREHFISSYQLNDIQTILNVKRTNIDGSKENSPQQKLEEIKVLYQPRFSTYPEVISREIVCDNKYKPLFGQIDSGSLTVYYAVGQLTDRLTFGACADDLIKYRGIQFFYRCFSPLVDIELTVAGAISDKFSEDYFNNLAEKTHCPNFFPGLPVSFTGIRQ